MNDTNPGGVLIEPLDVALHRDQQELAATLWAYIARPSGAYAGYERDTATRWAAAVPSAGRPADPLPVLQQAAERVVSVHEYAVPDAGDDVARFDQGYLDAHGDPALLDHVHRVMACEGSWLRDPGNPSYLSTAQFTPDTWERVRRAPDADWHDFYEVGFAVAVNIATADVYGQWPWCWPHTE